MYLQRESYISISKITSSLKSKVAYVRVIIFIAVHLYY